MESSRPSAGLAADLLDFENGEFDAATFVARLQSQDEQLPMELVQEQLRQQYTALKQRLYELINQDYPKFMTLANGLQGVEKKAANLRMPLLDLGELCEALQGQAQRSRETLEAELRQRQAIELRRRGTLRALHFTETLYRTEALLGIDHDDPAEDEEVLEAAQLGSTSPSAQGPLAAPTPLSRLTTRSERCELLERAAHASLSLLADLRSKDAAAMASPSGSAGSSPALHLQQLATRAKHLQHEVLQQLTAEFVAIVTPPDKFKVRGEHAVDEAALAPCLRAMAVLEHGEEIEQHYGTLLLQPFVHATLTPGRVDAGGARGSCAGLPAMFQTTLAYLRAACGSALRLSEGVFSGGGPVERADPTAKWRERGGGQSEESEPCLTGGAPAPGRLEIDLLCNGVWLHLQRALVSRLGDVLFSLGIADTFHLNYTATAGLLRGLETLCGDTPVVRRRVRRRLLAHEATQSLWKRWNLPVYFQLRVTELTGRLDAALAAPLTEKRLEVAEGNEALEWILLGGESGEADAACPSHRSLELVVTRQAREVLGVMWRRDRVFLQPLGRRFLHLSLQACRRALRLLGLVVDGKPPPPAEPWSPTSEELVLLAWDLEALGAWVDGQLVVHATNLLEGPGEVLPFDEEEEEDGKAEGVGAAVREAFAPEAEACSGLVARCWATIIERLVGSCEAQLQAVKGIPASYRMTNKPAPTRPSPFVPSLLEPLRVFQRDWGSRLPEAQIVGPAGSEGTPPARGKAAWWAFQVLLAVAERYQGTVLELLATVRQMEDALRKRQRALARATKAPTADQAGALSDADKIWLQLYLDVHEFGREVEVYGVDLAKFEPYQALLREVEPAKKFLQQQEGDGGGEEGGAAATAGEE